MDAFYASVEILSKPHLADVPMAVGSEHMLSTSNYVARSYGVRSAMPGFLARKLCPSLTIVPPNFAEYERISHLVDQVLSQYNPHFDKVGLDEAYVDISSLVAQRVFQDDFRDGDDDDDDDLEQFSKRASVAEGVVQEMRSKIIEATRLTASAGIAPNSMLAKVSSDMRKPNGQFTVASTREAVMSFITSLPVRKISGVGRVTEGLLKAEGVETCGDLIDRRAHLYLLNPAHTFEYLMRIGLGLGFADDQGGGEANAKDENKPSRKSMSVERTFEDTSNVSELLELCYDLCHCLSDDLRKEKLGAKCVTLKLKTHRFQVMTRASTLACHTSAFEPFYEASCRLLRRELRKSSLRIRLMGVRASNFLKTGSQTSSKQASIVDLFKDTSPPQLPQHSSHSHSASNVPTDQITETSPSINFSETLPHHRNNHFLSLKSSNNDTTERTERSDCVEDFEDNFGVGFVDDEVCDHLANPSNRQDCFEDSNVHDGKSSNDLSEEEFNHEFNANSDFNKNLNFEKDILDYAANRTFNAHQSPNEYTNNNIVSNSIEQNKASNDHKNDTHDNNGSCDNNFYCPVCNKHMTATSNQLLNQHIDECLNLRFINNNNNTLTDDNNNNTLTDDNNNTHTDDNNNIHTDNKNATNNAG